jgi:hypothetical protein
MKGDQIVLDEDDSFHLATLEEDRFADGVPFFKAMLGDRALIAYRTHDAEDDAEDGDKKPKQRWRLMISPVDKKGRIRLVEQQNWHIGVCCHAAFESDQAAALRAADGGIIVSGYENLVRSTHDDVPDTSPNSQREK